MVERLSDHILTIVGFCCAKKTTTEDKKISDTGNRTRGDNVKDCRVTDYTISEFVTPVIFPSFFPLESETSGTTSFWWTLSHHPTNGFHPIPQTINNPPLQKPPIAKSPFTFIIVHIFVKFFHFSFTEIIINFTISIQKAFCKMFRNPFDSEREFDSTHVFCCLS